MDRQGLKRLARPVLGMAAPALRAMIRNSRSGSAKRAIWRYGGELFSKGSWYFTTRTTDGCTVHGETADLLSRYLYFFGVWEPNITEWFRKTLRPGDTVVDVGANIGYYSLLASRLVGAGGRVVAVEASPSIFKALERNLLLNRCGNVRALNLAVSDRAERVEVYRGPDGNRGMTSIVMQEGLSFEATIDAKTLPQILRDDEVARTRIFKIDVEGAEWSVVMGLARLLSATRHDAEFIVEISPDRLQMSARDSDDIMRVFERAGFFAYEIENDYTSKGYIEAAPYAPPVRLRRPLETQKDVIFSRRDTAML